MKLNFLSVLFLLGFMGNSSNNLCAGDQYPQIHSEGLDTKINEHLFQQNVQLREALFTVAHAFEKVNIENDTLKSQNRKLLTQCSETERIAREAIEQAKLWRQKYTDQKKLYEKFMREHYMDMGIVILCVTCTVLDIFKEDIIRYIF